MIFAATKYGIGFLRKWALSLFLAGVLGITSVLADSSEFPRTPQAPSRRDLYTNAELAKAALGDGLVALAIDFSKGILKDADPADDAQLLNITRLILSSAQIECGRFAEAEKTLSELQGDSPAKTLRLVWAKIGQFDFWPAGEMLNRMDATGLSQGDLAWYSLARGILDKHAGKDAEAQAHFNNAFEQSIDAAQRAQFDYIRVWADVVFSPELPEEAIQTLREEMLRNQGTRYGAHIAKMLALSIYSKAQEGDKETHRAARQVLQDAKAQDLPPDLIPEFDLLEGFFQDSVEEDSACEAFMRVLAAENAAEHLQKVALDGLLRHVNALMLAGKKEAATKAAEEILSFLGKSNADKDNSASQKNKAKSDADKDNPASQKNKAKSDADKDNPASQKNKAKANVRPSLLDLSLFTQIRLAHLTGNSKTLEDDVEELRNKCPTSPFVRNSLRILIDGKRKSKKYRSAIPDLEKLRDAVADPSQKAKVNLMLADCYFQSGDYRLAADAYSKVDIDSDLGAHSGEIFFQRVLSKLLAQDFDAAMALIVAQQNAPQDQASRVPRTWLLQAECSLIEKLRDAGQVGKAQEACADFLRQTDVPDSYRVRVLWWDTLLAIELGPPETVIKNADAILAILEAHPQGIESIPIAVDTLKADILFLRALAILKQSDSREELEKARQEFSALRERFPGSKAAAISYLDEGRALATNNMNVDALRCFEELIKSCENTPSLTRYVEIAYFEAALQELALGKPLLAAARLKTLEEKFKNSPLTFYAMLRLGDLLREQNEFDEALLIYNKLLNDNRYSSHLERSRVEISTADCLSARISSVHADTKEYKNRQEDLAGAIAIYERIFFSNSSIELRAEAGYKWGETWAKRARLLEKPDKAAKDAIYREARKNLWQVTETIFNQATKGGVDPSETWGVTSGYWLARCFFAIGYLSTEIGDYEDARKAYTQIKNWSARGWIPGAEYATTRENEIRNK